MGDAWGGSWGSSWGLSWTRSAGTVELTATPTIAALTSLATIEVEGDVPVPAPGGGGGGGLISYKRLRRYREEYEEERRLLKERADLKKKLVVKEREQEKLEETIEDKVAASRQETAHLRAITKSQMEFRLRIQAINAALAEIRARIAFEEDEEEVAMLLLH